MSQASEQIARQFANANVNKVTWGNVVINVMSTGAIGDGVNDDTSAIQAAVALIPTTGGRLVIPPGTYRVTAPILLDKTIKVEMYGAVIKPSIDTDVFRTTGLFVEIEGGIIDGSNIVSGSGCGVVVGYGGYNSMQNRLNNLYIRNMKGHGVKWEQGPFLNVDNVIVQDGGGDGFNFTPNYDDNNHGIINAHVINCTGVGFRLKDNAGTPNNSSRSHLFVYAKAFGCTGGGFVIETMENAGLFFLELNGGTQGVLTATSKGNQLNILGVPAAYATVSDLGTGNMLMGSNTFDQATFTKMQAEVTRIRNTANVGTLQTNPYLDNKFETKPTDTTGDVLLKFTKGAANSFTVNPDQMIVGTSADASIVSNIMGYVSLIDFPSIAAGGTAVVNLTVTGITTTDVVVVTPVAGIEDGVVVTAAGGSGLIQVKCCNYTVSAKDPISRDFVILVVRPTYKRI